jgi:putative ABC transport system permease protein
MDARQYHFILNQLNNYSAMVVGVLIIAALIVVLWLFFYTELGLTLKSVGDNPDMSKAQGVNVNFNKVLGLAISNGIIALAGALLAQYQGFADINMGRGAVVIGLAAIFIGLSVSLKIKPNFVVSLIGVACGGVVYYLVYTFVIFLGLDTDLLKMLSAVIVTVFLAVPYVKTKYFTKIKKAGATKRVGGNEEVPDNGNA